MKAATLPHLLPENDRFICPQTKFIHKPALIQPRELPSKHFKKIYSNKNLHKLLAEMQMVQTLWKTSILLKS